MNISPDNMIEQSFPPDVLGPWPQLWTWVFEPGMSFQRASCRELLSWELKGWSICSTDLLTSLTATSPQQEFMNAHLMLCHYSKEAVHYIACHTHFWSSY